MDVWQFSLFGAAAILALRCLAGLMTRHRLTYRAELMVKAEAQRRQEKARAKREKQGRQQPEPTKSKGTAA